MSISINIIKRNGRKEQFDFKKIKKIISWATNGIEDVSGDAVFDNSKISFYEGITSKEIHSTVIESAVNLISIEEPNYQYVAGRLLNYSLRKEVWGSKSAPRLIDLVKTNVERGFYDKQLLEKYSVKELNKINDFIEHDRDFLFTHGGIKQLMDKYLVQNRKTKEIVETPQFLYALVAATLFINEDKDVRLKWVKKAYDYFSSFKINLATPVLAGARTPLQSYASCALFNVDDTLDSIGAHDYLFKKASASRYGLGLNVSRIRPINAKIRNGDVLHTGLVPYLKNFESGIKSCHQNGIRGASGTVFVNDWHPQVEEVVVLRDNALPDDRAVRHLDYSVCMSRLFIERMKKNEDYTLFNPHEVKELTNKFGLEESRKLYLDAEKNPELETKVKINARKLMTTIAKQRLETGRIYTSFVENMNEHNPFKEAIQQQNLCQEVAQPTISSQKWNDPNALVGVCILAAINPYDIKDDVEFEDVASVAVRMLDNLIDIQGYFDLAAKNFATKYRSLAIGTLNFAAYMARNKTLYIDKEAPNVAARLAEKISYYTIKASIGLAKERGKLEFYEKTKWADGILPIDHYKKTIDEFVTEPLNLDWEILRTELKQHGIRNSTLTAYMPVESSSVVSGSTSGIEPIRDYMVSKLSRMGKTIVIAPDVKKYKDYYTLAFDMKNNDGLLKVYAAINKFTDMAISANTYVNVAHYENKQIPLSVIVQDICKAENWGLKSLYYNNCEDGSHTKEEESSCAGGACKL